MSVLGITSRLRTLERRDSQQRRRTDNTQDYWFRVAPTCPPTPSVVVRAGIVYANPGFWFWLAHQAQVPETIADFANPTEPSGDGVQMDNAWNYSNAYWYKSCVMRYYYEYIESREPRSDNDWAYVFTFRTSPDEYETAIEAEAWLDSTALNGGSETLSYSAIPLCALVLRNNGTTGQDGQVMPIDRINRGRSYIYRDCRVRNNLW